MIETIDLPASYKPIAKLFLTGSERIITPWPMDKRQSWLDESEEIYKEYDVESDTFTHLAKLLGTNINISKLHGRLPILTEDKVRFDDASVSPLYLFGRVETNGALSIVAFFQSDTDGAINRIEHATISNFEVEWVVPPIPVSKNKTARPTDANQPAEL